MLRSYSDTMNPGSVRGRLTRIPPLAVDIGLAVAVAVAQTIAVSVADSAGARPTDAFAYALGLTIAALVLVRRRWPVGVLVASWAAMQLYFGLEYPDTSAGVPLAVAMYTAAAAGHLGWALAATTWYVIGGFLFGAVLDPGPLVQDINEIVRDGALLAAVLLFGDAVRTRRALMAETQERLQRAEADREREAQERKAARLIQLQLLPEELRSPPGWRVSTFYQPAQEVGGDFYDFLELPDGQVALVVGDVTDKGIPAALVMATTLSILRVDEPRALTPGGVLVRANERLCHDVPDNMFVTCLYAVLDLASGELRLANAGHNLPYVASPGGVVELRATGMPLGLMPGMEYEEMGARLAPGESMLLYSDGLTEAHNAAGEMFGFPRLQKVVANSADGSALIDECLTELRRFTGQDWEQEDDITLVALQRTGS